MPLPAILIGASIVAGVGGLVSGGFGVKKMYKAGKEMRRIDKRYASNQRHLDEMSESATAAMGDLGNLELEACESFGRFQEIIERIKNRPEFDEIELASFDIPRYDAQELRKVSVAAGLVVGAIGGVGAGSASGVVAAIAAKGAITAVCVASTGTPIAALHGIAATNAILAVLGGGTLAAGGGGIALGATVLSVAMAGVGILVGGVMFNLAGSSLSGKVDEARGQMLEAEEQINLICEYLERLKTLAERYLKCLRRVYDIYLEHMERFSRIVYEEDRTDWREYTDEERLSLENFVLLTGVLYGMCNTNLVIDSEDKDGVNDVNLEEAQKKMDFADKLIREKAL